MRVFFIRAAQLHLNGGLGGAAFALAGFLYPGSLNPVQLTTSKIETFGGDSKKLQEIHHDKPSYYFQL
ncbi:hypothetical protein [Erwinia aphidicola]|uniref:hypothetical protein n=1 Tax=Erwinia aphidicola TaxID=68334 RepID=UPI0030D0C660